MLSVVSFMNLLDMMPVKRHISSGLFQLAPFLRSAIFVHPAFAWEQIQDASDEAFNSNKLDEEKRHVKLRSELVVRLLIRSAILESESLTVEQSETLTVKQSESLTVEQLESLTVEQSESITVEQSESLTVEQPVSLTVEQSESLTVEQPVSLTVEQSESLTVEQSESLTVAQPESLTKKTETLYTLNLVSLSSPCSPNSLSPSSSTTSSAVLTSHSPPPSLPCSRSLQQRRKRTKTLIGSLPPSATTVSPPSFITTDLSLPQSCSPTAPSSTSQSLSQEGPYVKKGRKGTFIGSGVL
ncbi:hypothetical protein HF521_007420 [Silurus meridionalis]|uniref:Uncharacterized protein n=1 Tax=Silurus meridionalis TaxID=175797 RepID=A0A8T0ARF1_SILME|nr:hypothetical protein HF521_007420 [Silurus meridionalis]